MQRRFVVRPRSTAVVLGGLLFGFAAIWLGRLALFDDAAVRVDGLLLERPQAAVLEAVLAASSALFAVLAVASMWRSRGGRLAVAVDDRTISVPGHLLRPRPQVIAFRDIREVSLRRISGQEMMDIDHTAGRATIVRGMVGDAAFTELLAIFAERVHPSAPLPVARAQKSVRPIAK